MKIRRCLAWTVRQSFTHRDLTRIYGLAAMAAEDAAEAEAAELAGDIEVDLEVTVDVDACKIVRGQTWVDVDPSMSAAQVMAARVKDGEVVLAAEWVEMPGQESLL